MDVYTGRVSTVSRFDSNTQPATATAFQTISPVNCAAPLPAFEFTSNTWFEVQMLCMPATELTGVGNLSIMIGHEWLCP